MSSEKSYSVQVRKSSERGSANLGWLNSYHTFSFASYYDPKFDGFHSFRVLNEDRVLPRQGFGTHGHAEYEIFSYVVRGGLLHKDSMGNVETIKRGDIQYTSAGTGIRHSEYNASSTEIVHFLQLWVKPDTARLKPSYQTQSFSDADKLNQLRLVIAPPAEAKEKKVITMHQDVRMYASILEPGKSVSFSLAPGRDAYLHVIQDATDFDKEANQVGLKVGGQGIQLASGDGAFLLSEASAKSPAEIQLTGNGQAGAKTEFVLLDIAKKAKGSVQVDDD